MIRSVSQRSLRRIVPFEVKIFARTEHASNENGDVLLHLGVEKQGDICCFVQTCCKG
jgi:hypothetical protein